MNIAEGPDEQFKAKKCWSFSLLMIYESISQQQKFEIVTFRDETRNRLFEKIFEGTLPKSIA